MNSLLSVRIALQMDVLSTKYCKKVEMACVDMVISRQSNNHSKLYRAMSNNTSTVYDLWLDDYILTPVNLAYCQHAIGTEDGRGKIYGSLSNPRPLHPHWKLERE